VIPMGGEREIPREAAYGLWSQRQRMKRGVLI
jgi:hypothetical protein